MQLKRIGIAVVILAGGLVIARPWAQADRIGVFELAAQDSRKDSQTDGAGRFDPYTQGMGSPVIDLMWIQRNT